jgi:uroporphyrinogen III methyltransferase/synthase
MTGRLIGVSVAITRPPQQAAEMRELVEAEGGRAILFPTIEILPPADWSPCDAAIARLGAVDGIIFTSANGATNFLDRAAARGVEPASLGGKRVFAVGEATAKAVAGYGLGAAAVPEQFTSADLAKTIGATDLKGRTFLFPTGDLTPPAFAGSLGRLGASVETVVVYTTATPAQDNVDAFYAMVRDGKVSWITFTSPSAVNNFAKVFTGGRAGTVRTMSRIAVIGPTTAHAAEEAGFRPDAVASRSTAKELVEAICVLASARRPR